MDNVCTPLTDTNTDRPPNDRFFPIEEEEGMSEGWEESKCWCFAVTGEEWIYTTVYTGENPHWRKAPQMIVRKEVG